VTTVSQSRNGSPADAQRHAPLFVYGVTDADADPPKNLTGVGGREPAVVRVEGVAVVVGEIDPDQPLAQRDNLLGYHRVLDAVAAVATVAPLRFGTVVPDHEQLRELLAPRAEALRGLLGSLADRQQFNLRADYVRDALLSEIVIDNPAVRALREETRDQPEDATYGARVQLGELVARAAEEKSAGDAAALLDAVLPLTVGHAMHGTGGGLERLLDVALLVQADRAEELEDALEVLAEKVHDRIHLRLTGPLAPYDFVGAMPWDS
jgi:hypothetical protein